jgi:D,D-heptose 1,7-bisphosphate phosphatase
MTDAVILVGGRGTRLGKITKKTPKPLIRIENKRFLDILLARIIHYNFKNIYLLCSYKKNIFFKLYHNKIIHNSKIICIDEGSQMDTGGALYKIKNIIKNNFFLLNGDSFFDIDYKLLPKLLCKNSIGSIAIANNRSYKLNNKINNINISKSNFLFFSKSKTKFMNGGIYFFKKKIFKYIFKKKISLENEILPTLIEKKQIKGFFFKTKFIDIGIKKNLNFLKKNPNFLKQKAFFLDRDGVINKLIKNDYVKNIKEFNFLPGVFKSINFLNKHNYRVIIITNQSCIGKLIISEKKLNLIHNFMIKKIIKKNGIIDDIFYSSYFKYSKLKKYRLNYFDRKPNPGLLIKAIKKWNIDINKSFFVGDSKTDLLAAKKINLKFFYKYNKSLYNQIKKIIIK